MKIQGEDGRDAHGIERRENDPNVRDPNVRDPDVRDANVRGADAQDAGGQVPNDCGANMRDTNGQDRGGYGADGRDRAGRDADDPGMERALAELRAEDGGGTARLAERLADWAEPGTVIALDGDLGAGKTFFAQAFARRLGVREVVNSPTFTIIKEYEDGRLPLYHMDVYRLSQDEADELGLDEYFYGQGVVLVEWARLIPDLLPPARLQIEIGHAGGNARVIRLTGTGQPYADWCRKLAEKGASGE